MHWHGTGTDAVSVSGDVDEDGCCGASPSTDSAGLPEPTTATLLAQLHTTASADAREKDRLKPNHG